MADLPSPLYTEQTTRSTLLHSNPSARLQQCPLRMFRLDYTFLGTEATNDVIQLGFPQLAGYLKPEGSRVSIISGTVVFTATIRKRNAAGTSVALTAAAAVSTNSVALVRVADVPQFLDTDYLECLMTSVTTPPAGGVVRFELEYYSEAAS